MTHSFNLVDEGFIPCLMADGTPRELGLKDALCRAHEIREIRDASPLVTVSLLRLLLAILHRNFGPENTEEWKRLWRGNRFDGHALSAYFDAWRGRFDLFDETYPLYQTSTFQVKRPSGSSRLFHELASGNNATLFDHTTDQAPPPLSAARAARLVIAQQNCALGGGRSETGYTSHAPLIQGAVICPMGDSLFQTLLLNMVAYNASEPLASEDDAPVWERSDPPPPSSDASAPRGYLDYLTWQSRTLALHVEPVDGAAVVSSVSLAQGRKLQPEGLFDPMMHYGKHPQRGWTPLRLGESRALWRDSAALFRIRSEEGKRPECFNWLARLIADGVLPSSAQFRFAVFGVCSNQAKIAFWRTNRMPLPLAYLTDIDLVDRLDEALQRAEDCNSALRKSVWQAASAALAPDGGQPDKARVRAMLDSLAPERRYWSGLEAPFWRLLVNLPGSDEHQDRTIARWVCSVLYRRAWKAFDETAGRLDGSARLLKAVSTARHNLGGRLAAVVKDYRQMTEGDNE